VAHYVMLSTLSESGRKVIHARQAGSARSTGSCPGAEPRCSRSTGARPYDFVTVLERPTTRPCRSISIEMGAAIGADDDDARHPLDTFINRLERSRSVPGRKGKRR